MSRVLAIGLLTTLLIIGTFSANGGLLLLVILLAPGLAYIMYLDDKSLRMPPDDNDPPSSDSGNGQYKYYNPDKYSNKSWRDYDDTFKW